MGADKTSSKLRRQKRQPTQEEADLIARSDALRDTFIQVDVFDKVGVNERTVPRFVRPALQGTEELLSQLEHKTFGDAIQASATAPSAESLSESEEQQYQQQ